MLNSTNSQPWYKRTNRQTLDDRVKSVQNVNDPTIISDDVQRWSTIAIGALLAFTTFLSTFSYFKFFETSFGMVAAGIMALLLAGVIEFGKNWGTLKVLRQPFFNGWDMIKSEVHHSVMWFGLLLLAIVTFGASVYNSTHGAAQLSLLLGHEKHTETFAPETSAIDVQIAATQKSMAANRDIKWKGVVTYQAQKAIQKESGALDKLQNQRTKVIDQQRADFEARQTVFSDQNAFSSNSLMAVGGWVELLQLILMFVRVAAERSLDQTASQRINIPSPIGYQPYQGTTNGAAVKNEHQMGFFWKGYGNAPDTPPPTVSQFTQPVTQDKIFGCDEILQRCKTAVERDLPNFNQKWAKNKTVADRIYKALDNCREAIQHPEFAPNRVEAIKFYSFLIEKAIPTLNDRGWPYSNDMHLLARIRQLIPGTTTV